jgi:hypothetical protein
MKWRVNWILWIVAPILIIAGPTVILLLVMPKEQIFFQKIFNSLLSRIVYTPAEAIYYYFEVFPDKIGFLGGTSIKTLSTILGTGYFNAPEFVFRYWFHLPFTIGAASAGFIAIMYANWGMPGVLLIGLITGFIIQLGQILICSGRRTVLSLAFISFLMYSAWLLNSIDLFVILQTDGVVISIFIYWLFLRASKKTSDYKPVVQNSI